MHSTCESGADVGAQRERVHAVKRDDPHAHQWRQSGGEDGGALDQDGHPRPQQDGQVPSEIATVPGEVRVDELLDHFRHWTLGRQVTFLVVAVVVAVVVFQRYRVTRNKRTRTNRVRCVCVGGWGGWGCGGCGGTT